LPCCVMGYYFHHQHLRATISSSWLKEKKQIQRFKIPPHLTLKNQEFLKLHSNLIQLPPRITLKSRASCGKRKHGGQYPPLTSILTEPYREIANYFPDYNAETIKKRYNLCR